MWFSFLLCFCCLPGSFRGIATSYLLPVYVCLLGFSNEQEGGASVEDSAVLVQHQDLLHEKHDRVKMSRKSHKLQKRAVVSRVWEFKIQKNVLVMALRLQPLIERDGAVMIVSTLNK
jgi:hypothetical protein